LAIRFGVTNPRELINAYFPFQEWRLVTFRPPKKKTALHPTRKHPAWALDTKRLQNFAAVKRFRVRLIVSFDPKNKKRTFPFGWFFSFVPLRASRFYPQRKSFYEIKFGESTEIFRFSQFL
jgi:hypothetical protein